MTALGRPVVIVVEHTDYDGVRHFAGEVAHVAADIVRHPRGKTALVFGRKGKPVWTMNSHFKNIDERRIGGPV